jgi:hypothetical protein
MASSGIPQARHECGHQSLSPSTCQHRDNNKNTKLKRNRLNEAF